MVNKGIKLGILIRCSPLQYVHHNEEIETLCANHVFLENGQCNRFWVPLLLTVDDDDEDEFERKLWDTELVDEHELRLLVDTWPPLENISITLGLFLSRLFLSKDSKHRRLNTFSK
jgi:hypothetical protein